MYSKSYLESDPARPGLDYSHGVAPLLGQTGFSFRIESDNSVSTTYEIGSNPLGLIKGNLNLLKVGCGPNMAAEFSELGGITKVGIGASCGVLLADISFSGTLYPLNKFGSLEIGVRILSSQFSFNVFSSESRLLSVKNDSIQAFEYYNQPQAYTWLFY